MRSTRFVFTAAVGLAVLLAACSSSSTPGRSSSSGGETVRTIKINALDLLKFDPARVTVRAGERVRFVVTNPGSTKHEFIVGDEATQMAHEEEMGMGSGMQQGGMDLPALELAPGETKEATVTFDQAGTMLYGCHVPGHYKGGMVGTINITA